MMKRLLEKHSENRFSFKRKPVQAGTRFSRRTVPEERIPDADFVTESGRNLLNLTAANHVIHYDRWWNPAVENQATDRAYRIYQERFVHVHKLITTGTIEEKLMPCSKRNKR